VVAADVAAQFAASLGRLPRPGDVIANLLLFLPFGFFGMRTLPHGWSRRRRWLAVGLGGLALSLTVESLQTFIPFRVTNAYDVIWNTLSTGLGGALALLGRARHRPSQPAAFRP
jgi:glycopeptide antibiotics resistance protein